MYQLLSLWSTNLPAEYAVLHFGLGGKEGLSKWGFSEHIQEYVLSY